MLSWDMFCLESRLIVTLNSYSRMLKSYKLIPYSFCPSLEWWETYSCSQSMRIHLKLKSIKSVLESEPFLNVAWEWVKPVSVLVFADCLQHGSSHSSLHIWHCGPSYQQDSMAHHLAHCILCGDSSAFCGLVQEISKADEGSCSLTVT